MYFRSYVCIGLVGIFRNDVQEIDSETCGVKLYAQYHSKARIGE